MLVQVLDMVDAGVDVDSFISAQQRLDLYAKHVRCSLDTELAPAPAWLPLSGTIAERLRTFVFKNDIRSRVFELPLHHTKSA